MATPQMSMNRGFKVFGLDDVKVVGTEIKQLHDLTAVKPKNVKERTVQERRETLAYLMFLKRKSMAVDVPMVGNSGHIQTRTRRHRQPSLHRLYF